MKSNQQKYDEAVTRNLKSFKKRLQHPVFASRTWSVEEIKAVIGIRAGDSRFDDQITVMIHKATNSGVHDNSYTQKK